MSRLDTAILRLKEVPGGAWRDRFVAEACYARRVSEALDGKHEALVLTAAAYALEAVSREGALTENEAKNAERILFPMREDCKKYRLIVVGHAHIDMNWMWRYDETVQITLDTFDTVLRLMDEFPEFTFSQSQASVYRIVEEYDPDMLERIAARVREGRWEVSASTWVEADRNMPSAEAVARHQLYTKRYLPKLLKTDQADCDIDFEPDTFGHHANVPELLSQAGVKYYYHCRGDEGEFLYRWRAPSGAEVLCYREPFWYNGTIEPDNLADYTPGFCEKYHTDTALRVYGVGDHGGGPTRRDILRLIDTQSWPIYPQVAFGSLRAFYERADKSREALPVVDAELNPLFVGCYTTQTRIKKGNRYAERLMAESETVSALAHAVVQSPYRRDKFEEGWRNVLFNQFHDILPGSGVLDTREYAMGLYQQSYAVANSAKRTALHAVFANVDTSKLGASLAPEDVSVGAGTGYRVEETLSLAPTERGGGSTRLFHLYNSLPFPRKEAVELTVWDHKDENRALTVTDSDGKPVRWQKLSSGRNEYWGHNFLRLLIEADLPALGYATYAVSPEAEQEDPIPFQTILRVEHGEDWIIENEILRAECDPAIWMGNILLTDKRDGSEFLIDGFKLAMEDASRGMTAWTTGATASEQVLWEGVSVKRTAKGALKNELTAKVSFGEKSSLTYRVSLTALSPVLAIDGECDWLETGDKKRLPQLRFDVTDEACDCDEYVYDIPGGVLRREGCSFDLPGLRFVASDHLMLMSDSKYGYRGGDGSMGVTLLRSSTDPDPYPELGRHRFSLAVSPLENGDNMTLSERAQRFSSAVTVVSGTSHEGKLPLKASLLQIEGGTVELYAVKLAEDGESLILRGAELTGKGCEVTIRLPKPARRARFTDVNERAEGAEIACEGERVRFAARAFGEFTIRVDLD